MSDDIAVVEVVEGICNRLEERTATLFLGAGVNAGLFNAAGEPFPMGSGLSTWIAQDLLDSPELEISLEEAAEMARFRLGEAAVNEYIYRRFAAYEPGIAHLALVQIPWDVIYTTNYDTLVEEAASRPSVRPAGIIRPIFGLDDESFP